MLVSNDSDRLPFQRARLGLGRVLCVRSNGSSYPAAARPIAIVAPRRCDKRKRARGG